MKREQLEIPKSRTHTYESAEELIAMRQAFAGPRTKTEHAHMREAFKAQEKPVQTASPPPAIQPRHDGAKPLTPRYNPFFDQQAYKLRRMGFSDARIADTLCISIEKLEAWKRSYPTFAAAFFMAFEDAQYAVYNSLIMSASGHEKEVTTKFIGEDGEERSIVKKIYYPPDTKAQQLFVETFMHAAPKPEQVTTSAPAIGVTINNIDLNNAMDVYKKVIQGTASE